MCNTCIFEEKVQDLKFTAVVVKELKERFSKEFERYRHSLASMGDADPKLVKDQIQISVTHFFNQLREKVQDLRRNVMSQIEGSESWKNLEQVVQQNQEFFKHVSEGDNRKDLFEDEKRKFDDKISKGRFAYVVKR